MGYSTFNIRRVKDELHVAIVEERGIFAQIGEIEISDMLTRILEEHVPIAIAINTEKARSELILANLFVELRRHFHAQISFFSGIAFDVDQQRELNGFCDFIISRSAEQLELDAPVVTIVEAKNENLTAYMGQCMAEMVAAQIFNARAQRDLEFVYGIVTSGTAWRFLKLTQQTVSIDLQEYYIDNARRILGILAAMIDQKA